MLQCFVFFLNKLKHWCSAVKRVRDLPARGAVLAGCAAAGGALSERGVSSLAPFCLASLRALLTSRLRALLLPLLSRKHVTVSVQKMKPCRLSITASAR